MKDCTNCVLLGVCADHVMENSPECDGACAAVQVASDSDAASNPYLREVEAENAALRARLEEVEGERCSKHEGCPDCDCQHCRPTAAPTGYGWSHPTQVPARTTSTLAARPGREEV